MTVVPVLSQPRERCLLVDKMQKISYLRDSLLQNQLGVVISRCLGFSLGGVDDDTYVELKCFKELQEILCLPRVRCDRHEGTRG